MRPIPLMMELFAWNGNPIKIMCIGQNPEGNRVQATTILMLAQEEDLAPVLCMSWINLMHEIYMVYQYKQVPSDMTWQCYWAPGLSKN